MVGDFWAQREPEYAEGGAKRKGGQYEWLTKAQSVNCVRKMGTKGGLNISIITWV